MRSESSSTEMPFSSSIQSSVETLVAISPCPRFHRTTARRPPRFRLGRSSSERSCFGGGRFRRPRPPAPRPAPPRAPRPAALLGGRLLARRCRPRPPRPAASSAAGGSPVTRPCSAIWASWRREAGDHVREPGDQPGQRARREPTSWPCSTSSPGSRAIAVNPSGSSVLAVHEAALVDEHPVLAGEVRDRLRGDHRVAVDQRQRRRPDQQLVERLGAGVARRRAWRAGS